MGSSRSSIQIFALYDQAIMRNIFVPPSLKDDLFMPVERMESCRFQTTGEQPLRISRAGVKVHFLARYGQGH